MLSDHSLVSCRLPVAVERASVFEQQARGWRRVDRANLRRVFRLDALALSVIATETWLAGWLAGWVGGCLSQPVLYQND